MPTYNIRNTSVQDWRDTMMSKAEFNAVAAERRANRAGSGFDEFGKHYHLTSSFPNINDGMFTLPTQVNGFKMGWRDSSALGSSKTLYPITSINGVNHRIENLNSTFLENLLLLPPAPTVLPSTATLTQQQIDSGVIKHADASNSGLIINGKFTVDASGWTAGIAGTFTSTGGRLRVAYLANNYPSIMQTITTVIGKKYVLEVDHFYTASADISIDVFVGGTATRLVPEYNVATSGRYTIEFIATTVTTTIELQSIAASAGQYSEFDNIAVFPADAISRSDLVFLESWHEDISEKDFVYPLGNVQYLGTTGDSGTPVAGAFAGAVTYSLFSDTWQADSALIGKGYVWSTLSDANKKAFVANPENNCYLDGDKVIQVRYRMRVVQGWGDNWGNLNILATTPGTGISSLNYGSTFAVSPKGKLQAVAEFNTGYFYSYDNNSNLLKDIGTYSTGYATDISYNGYACALPIALVHRRNQGAYHPVYNGNGVCMNVNVIGNGWVKWYESTARIPNSLAMCMTEHAEGGIADMFGYGAIGTITGRADGIFYDQIHEGDILDLRNSSQKAQDYNRLIDREFNRLVAGTYRGTEKESFTESKLQTTSGTVATVEVNDGTKYSIGDIIQIYDLTAASVKGRFTVKTISTNTLTIDTAFAKLANTYVIGGMKK